MRIKEIGKLQSGGSIPPFQAYQNMNFGGQQTQNKQETSSSKDDFDIGAHIAKMKGLPSDIKAFTDIARNAISGPFGSSTIDKNSMQYFELMAQLGMVNSSKELYDKAVENAVNNKSLNDYALTSRDGIAVYTGEGELSVISLKEYDPSKYKAATVSDIIKERATNKSMAFNQELIDIISSSVGREVVVEKLDKRLKEIKTSDATTKETQLLQSGVAEIQSKTQSGTQTQNAYSAETANYALTTLYNGLTRKEQLLLELVASEIPGTPNAEGKPTQRSGKDVILDIIKSRSFTSTTLESKPEDLGGGSGSGSGGSTGKIKVSQTLGILRDQTGTPGKSVIKMGDRAMTVDSWKHASLTGYDGKPVNSGTMSDLIDNAEIGEVLDTSKMFFGDVKVDKSDLTAIAYDSTNGAKSMYIPVKDDGTPDLNILRVITNTEAQIKRSFANPTQAQIEHMYKVNKIPNYLNYRDLNSPKKPGSTPVAPGRLRRFLIVEGLAPENKIRKVNEKDDYFTAHNRRGFDEGTGTEMEDKYKRILLSGAKSKTERKEMEETIDDNLKGGSWFTYDPNILEGSLFIPIIPDEAPALRRIEAIRMNGLNAEQVDTQTRENTSIEQGFEKPEFEK